MMQYGNVELHNVVETLSGGGLDVLPPAAQEWIGQQPGGLEAWRKVEAKGRWLSRIPEALRGRLNALAQINALQATAAETRFLLDPGAALNVTLQCPLGPSIAEIYQGDFMVGWQVIDKDPATITIQLPETLAWLQAARERCGGRFDARLCRLVLPWRPPVRLLGIEGECRPPEPGMAPARRWLAYGSSITHGNQCIHPSGSYAMRAAQRAGADLINMGFGGGAHLEPEMADYIASRDDWDLATLEMGINILGLGVAEFAHRVEYFINTIAAAHPSKPVFGIDIFTSNEDFSGTGNTAAFRRTVRRLVRESGKANLFYLSGRHLLTTADGLTSDLVHPSPHGMEEIAERLARAVSGRLAALRFTPPQAG